MKEAIFKFNNRKGALLCSGCRVILKTGAQMTIEEQNALRGHVILPAQYCDNCKIIKNEISGSE